MLPPRIAAEAASLGCDAERLRRTKAARPGKNNELGYPEGLPFQSPGLAHKRLRKETADGDCVNHLLLCLIYYIVNSVPDPRQLLGTDGERIAETFLRRQRYVILQRNYRCRSGEIDLIALDRDAVVFVEVKTRVVPGFGTPFEAVHPHKQRQIIRAAQRYLSENRLQERNARFDVVGVWWDDGQPHCELIKNAFDAA